MKLLFLLAALTLSCQEYIPRGESPIEPVIPHVLPPKSETNTDTYEQVSIPKVDVLWVIDNSCSMMDEQTKLTANFPIYFSHIADSELDYHIGVVSTDMFQESHSGKLIEINGVKWIDPSTPYPQELFSSMSSLGTMGSVTEKGVLAAYSAMELQPKHNAGFFRDDSAIHIITVSDEPDMSETSPISDSEFADYFMGLRSEDEDTRYHVIVSWPQGDIACASNGSDYISLNEQIGGVFVSICSVDWSNGLGQLGIDAVPLKTEYFLTQKPIEESIVVSVLDNGYTIIFEVWNSVLGTGAYVYNESRNSITFLEYRPPLYSKVSIEYTLLSSGQ